MPLTEHCLVGPMLASLMVCLALRMRLSRARIQEFLHDWLSVDLSRGTINRSVHEAGRAVAPVEDQLPEQYAKRLAEFEALCESHRDCEHPKTRALAREFLNDWEAIWIVLQYHQLPLTNNEAEVRFVDPKPSLPKVWGMGPEPEGGNL